MGQVFSIIVVIGFGIIQVARGESFCIGIGVSTGSSLNVKYGIGDTSFKVSLRQASTVLPRDGSTFVFDPNNQTHRSIFVGRVPQELPDEVLDVDTGNVIKFRDGKKLQGATVDTSTHASIIKSAQANQVSVKPPKSISVPKPMQNYGPMGCGIPVPKIDMAETGKFIGDCVKVVNDVITAIGEGVSKSDPHPAAVGYFIDRRAEKNGWTQEQRLEERKKLGAPLDD